MFEFHKCILLHHIYHIHTYVYIIYLKGNIYTYDEVIIYTYIIGVWCIHLRSYVRVSDMF